MLETLRDQYGTYIRIANRTAGQEMVLLPSSIIQKNTYEKPAAVRDTGEKEEDTNGVQRKKENRFNRIYRVLFGENNKGKD